jgi:formylglycine-generating enzyme required for sulfatase activity
MRKYRNGKQSREPRQLSKYSPEYIQYRGNRGGYSVKVGLCDITGDGDADTISVAWRNPANGKVENCTVSIPQAQIPASGPSGLTATESIPASGPSGLTATMQAQAPASGPSNLTASESIPVSGPSSLTATEVTQSTGDESSFSISSTVSLEMLYVEPGTFTMGSPTTEPGRQANREDERNVSLTKGFYLGKYAVTQAQYEAVMTGNTDSLSATPSEWPNNPNRPVEKVSWTDAQIFLTRLNAQQSANIPAGWTFTLPTEAQWEYACRAGTTTAYSWGTTIASSNANYNWDGAWNTGNDFKQTRDVGQYAANPWGFFDMHGNVWEWTADWYNDTYPVGNPLIDPTGAAPATFRAYRGGSWSTAGSTLRSAMRYYGGPGYSSFNIGFRVALTQT